ncbi:hypothetical protein [Paracoccus sediminicola]|uniref:hypothetical protein n=1 Tax=Paracoccus sediminicola TaxID=3017783 RepID=UPI0022F0E338|nr:hypothetical protein [Paracoccus sediminicola]WBU56695.1 hypothetical protein PAF18_14675 [Paracoccus sediminicola]
MPAQGVGEVDETEIAVLTLKDHQIGPGVIDERLRNRAADTQLDTGLVEWNPELCLALARKWHVIPAPEDKHLEKVQHISFQSILC